MREWLILTTVDVLARPNNREHQLLHQLAPRFARTTVVFRRRCERGPLLHRIRDAIVPSVAVTEANGIRYVAVNPPLNHYEGMVREAVRPPDGEAPATWRAIGRRAVRDLVRKGADPGGIVKDAATVAALALAAARHGAGGPNTVCTALGPWAAGAARILAASGRIGSWIYEDRDFEPGFMEPGLRQRWTSRMEISGIRAASACVTIGGRLARLREAQTGRRPVLIPSGTTGCGEPVPPLEAREPLLVYVGNIANWAGLEHAIRSMPVIRRTIGDASLLVLGEGTVPVVGRLRALADSLGVADAVQFMPTIPHPAVRSELTRARLGLAIFDRTPLRVHAMPLKTVEYMSAGVPVITTAGTESGDIVERHRCGVCIDPSPDTLAKAAIRIMTDAACWAEFSTNGWSAARHYDWASLMQREWEVIQRVSGGAPTGEVSPLRVASAEDEIPSPAKQP